MNGKLTTHVLDTASGRPAAGMRLELHRFDDARERVAIIDTITDADGRTKLPLLAGESFSAGNYRLMFYVGEYFAARGSPDAMKFLDRVPILFRIDDPSANYHVPLLVSPWAYSTYRGS